MPNLCHRQGSMTKVQESTLRKTLTVEPTVKKNLTVATSRIPWRPVIALLAGIAVMSVVVLSGQELKHVPPAASSFMVLYNFTGYPTDGAEPYAGLIRDPAGNLYGATFRGGADDAGVVFKLTSTGTETILHSFTGEADGAGPYSGLIQDVAGNLYGTTSEGGAQCQEGGVAPGTCGVVFKLSPSGTETVLHAFTGHPTDGAAPVGGLIRDPAGNLYGTTANGGAFSPCSQGPLVACGTVFKLGPTGTETVLYNFTGGPDGANPLGCLIRDAAGNLYGTTVAGGVGSKLCAGGCGTVFKVAPSGTETVLYSFTGGADGGQPTAGLISDAAGNLYGTTYGGGRSGACFAGGGSCGVVFKLSPTGTYTVLHSFTGGADGGNPDAGLIQDAAGNLYGTTYGGGASSLGVVFELIRCDSGSSGYDFKVLHSFTGPDGASPYSPLVRDAAGNFYGTTAHGGAYGGGANGVVFRLTP
jgi:uncharacterized repeat protein (TIGR03803 family)